MSTAPVHGYGGKPLADKLGLTERPGWRVLSIDAPPEYPDLLADVWPLAAYTAKAGRQVPRTDCAGSCCRPAGST